MRDGARLLVVSCLAAAGCGGGPGVADDTGEWIRETTTEGNVTTIRTLGGSVWGGTARLEEGRYPGGVEIPEHARLAYPRAFIRDDMMIAYHEDELGTPRVRRYRLPTPGQEGAMGGS